MIISESFGKFFIGESFGKEIDYLTDIISLLSFLFLFGNLLFDQFFFIHMAVTCINKFTGAADTLRTPVHSGSKSINCNSGSFI